MNQRNIKILQGKLLNPILIKKKENLLYLTGRSFMQGYLLVKPSRRHSERSEESQRKRSFGRQRRPQDDAVVFFGDGLEKAEGIHTDILKNVRMYLGKQKVLDLEDEFTFAEYNYIKCKLKDAKRKVKLQHVKSPVDFQRALKDEQEIAFVKKSMQIVERVFGLVRREIKKPGITEIRLANFIKSSGLKMGAQDISFPPIVASGQNAAVPHHVPSSKRLKAGESIILDFGFKYKNYCSDFTRTVFLKKVPPKLEMVYNQVEKAYKECMSLRGVQPTKQSHQRDKLPRPSDALGARNDRPVTGNELYQKSVSVLAEKHLDKYFIHSLGHGTGLEIHELPNLSPKSKDILQDGMVFSIEPGVYIPNQGGVRIEDLVYLKGNKVNKFIDISTKLESNIIK